MLNIIQHSTCIVSPILTMTILAVCIYFDYNYKTIVHNYVNIQVKFIYGVTSFAPT